MGYSAHVIKLIAEEQKKKTVGIASHHPTCRTNETKKKANLK
jgi:hypothetical protein